MLSSAGRATLRGGGEAVSVCTTSPVDSKAGTGGGRSGFSSAWSGWEVEFAARGSGCRSVGVAPAGFPFCSVVTVVSISVCSAMIRTAAQPAKPMPILSRMRVFMFSYSSSGERRPVASLSEIFPCAAPIQSIPAIPTTIAEFRFSCARAGNGRQSAPCLFYATPSSSSRIRPPVLFNYRNYKFPDSFQYASFF